MCSRRTGLSDRVVNLVAGTPGTYTVGKPPVPPIASATLHRIPMAEPIDNPDPRRAGTLLDHWRMIEHDASWFILANFLDAAMTWIVLMYGGGPGLSVVEGNRIAAWFLNHWGFKGMFGLKLGVVVTVCLIAMVIAQSRLKTALWLLRLGTLIVILVVLYSIVLYVRVRAA